MSLTKNPLGTLFLTLAACVPAAAQEGPAPPPAAMGGPTAAENWWHKFWDQVEVHRKRVNVWPDAFVPEDREMVRRPFRQMVDNGWKSQNTFTDYLFDPASHELTSAGQAKLHYILTQIPPHRRQIHVLEAATQEETAARVASVYRGIAQIAPDTSPCAVLTTKIVPRGGEGWYLYEVEQAYRKAPPGSRLAGAASGGSFGPSVTINNNSGGNGSSNQSGQ